MTGGETASTKHGNRLESKCMKLNLAPSDSASFEVKATHTDGLPQQSLEATKLCRWLFCREDTDVQGTVSECAIMVVKRRLPCML